MPLSHTGGQQRHLGNFTVANLPTTTTDGYALAVGDMAYATNGRAGAEGAGNGTGTLVVWNGTNWKRVEDWATIAA